MKKLTTLFVLLMMVIINKNCFSQTTFQEAFVGSNTPLSVKQTSDGGFVAVGSTTTFGAGSRDIYLVKTNSTGNIVWSKTYGGAGAEWANSIEVTTDGGFIMAGATNSFGAGGTDVYIIKTDSLGDTLWSKTYGGINIDGGYGNIQQTTDGGYIVVSSTNSFGQGDYDVYLIKTNSVGDTLWTKTYGNNLENKGNSVKQTSDGGYIIVGSSYTPYAGNMVHQGYLIKTDSIGTILWSEQFIVAPQPDWQDMYGMDLLQTNDGGYMVTGYVDDYADAWHNFLLAEMKLDSLGNIITSHCYDLNDTYGSVFGAGALHTTSDGGYIISGYFGIYDSMFNTIGQNILLIKKGGTGLPWTKKYGIAANYFEGNEVIQTSDGGYAVSGTNESSYFLIKTDSLGNSNSGCTDYPINLGGPFSLILGTPPNTIQSSEGIVHSVPTQIGVGGNTVYNPCSVGINEIRNPQSTIEIYPNPFSSQTTITFSSEQRNTALIITDVLGNKIRNYELGIRNEKSFTIDMNGYAKGIYFVSIKTEKGITNRKIVLE